jgi:hypothetical protein
MSLVHKTKNDWVTRVLRDLEELRLIKLTENFAEIKGMKKTSSVNVLINILLYGKGN